MCLKKLFPIIFILLIGLTANPPISFSAKKKLLSPYRVSARAAIFSNSTEVKRYYGKNVHMKVPPASTSKVLTALIVLERLPLDKVVTVSPRATSVQPSKINLKSGERFKVRDLLFALLMNSANDASVVLAEAVAGSQQQFVKLMNQRARQLGAKNTRFVNAHGLPTQRQRQYTTPYDMYLIFREALKHQFFRKAITYKYKKISSLAGRKVQLKTHNQILFKSWRQKIYGKTGYTKAAGSCFVGYLKKGKSICIIAVFGCSHRWSDIKHIVSNYGGVTL